MYPTDHTNTLQSTSCMKTKQICNQGMTREYMLLHISSNSQPNNFICNIKQNMICSKAKKGLILIQDSSLQIYFTIINADNVKACEYVLRTLCGLWEGRAIVPRRSLTAGCGPDTYSWLSVKQQEENNGLKHVIAT